jgi:two-component system, OmpR family, phosphate regulon response regulator PhoB
MAGHRILVVDDEEDLLELIRYNLTKEGYRVECAVSGEQAIQEARASVPDLIVLDLLLPNVDGLDVCKHLKSDPKTQHVPIVMLTAKSEEADVVTGLELGADDYITKPFSVRELVLRIRAVLRRRELPVTDGPSIEFGNLRLDRAAHRVWVETEEVELTALEFKLLVTLYERRNRVQSRSALLDEVWGIDTKISTRTVDAHVKRLREKMGAARDYIETVRGVGYRFAEVPVAEAFGTG